MTNLWKILGLGLASIFLIFILSVQMITSGQDNLSQDNLTNAVHSALVSSRDNSARTNQGSFVIDKQKFNQTLGDMSIKEYVGHRLQYDRDFQVDYLPDDDSGMKTNTNSNYEPIKAISVRVNLSPNLRKETSAKQNTHVITNVIQKSDNNDDQSNDLTR